MFRDVLSEAVLQSFGQVRATDRATMFRQGMRTSSLSQARNMLRPAMLRYVASKCCDRLAGACK